MNYICPNSLHTFYIAENIVLINNHTLVNSIENISKRVDGYEWDLICLFKIQESILKNITNLDVYCKCLICSNMNMEQIINIKKYIYIMEFMKTITSPDIFTAARKFINSGKGKRIAIRIDEYYNFMDRFSLGEEQGKWKDKEWYYEKIFGFPRNEEKKEKNQLRSFLQKLINPLMQ